MENEEIRAWIADVLELVHEGGVEQSMFRSALNARLSVALNARGAKPDGSLATVVAEEVVELRRHFPEFDPDIDPHLPLLPWPDAPYTSLEADLLEAAAKRFTVMR
jgi:hypothetical protein